MPKTFSQSELAGAGLRTYNRIAEAWELGPEERSTLIGLDESSYAAALADPGLLSEQSLQRIGLAIDIYGGLHTIFADPGIAVTWIRRANSGVLFDGRPALELMLTGSVQLERVRDYLASEAGC